MRRVILGDFTKGFDSVGALRRLALSLILLFHGSGVPAREVTFVWDANTEPILGGYRLYYGPADSKYTSIIDVGNQTTYTVFGLSDDVMYCFAATAYDTTKMIESAFSNSVAVFPTTLGIIANPYTGLSDKGKESVIDWGVCKGHVDLPDPGFSPGPLLSPSG